MAKEYNLEDDWVNADVMHSDSFSYNLFQNAVLYKVYNNILNVYIVSEIDLFCMKLVSYRYKDKSDLDKLSKSLIKNGVTYQDIINEFVFLYGSIYLLKEKQLKYLQYNHIKN